MFTTNKRNEPGTFEPSARTGGTSQSTTLIAQGVRVEGDFSSDGDVVIEGELQGAVKVTGMLTIGGQAVIRATVSAARALIGGTVQGNISVQTHLDLQGTAKIMGDVTCETIAVESGAKLNGKIVTGQPMMEEKGQKKTNVVADGGKT